MEMGEDRVLTAAEAQSLEDTITVPKTYREAASDEHWVKSMNRELFALNGTARLDPYNSSQRASVLLRLDMSTRSRRTNMVT